MFDAHGRELTVAGDDPFGYGAQWGYYTDRETGLQLLTHRYYDTSTGRFLTRDPSGYDGGINLYSYVSNNPVNDDDPLGLWGRKRGGPYHPPAGVSTKCTMYDSCSTLKGKMAVLDRMIRSHTGWDRHVPKPNGGNRHSEEIAGLWNAYAKCQALYARKCGSTSSPRCSPAPVPAPAPRRNPGPTLEELQLQEQSHREMERFWGTVSGGGLILGGVLIGGPGGGAATWRWLAPVLAF